MKKRYAVALFAVAAALVTSAFAGGVSSTNAELVARGWCFENGAAFGAHGGVKAVTAEYDENGQLLWYAVSLADGLAIVAPDTEIEPVIAFLPGLSGTVPEGNPIRAILKKDLAGRIGAVSQAASLNVVPSGLKAASGRSGGKSAKWQKLERLGQLKALPSGGGTPAKVVRLLDGWSSADTTTSGGKTVQTLRFWDQKGSENYFTDSKVFNLYTPSNSACGCVATAGASVLQYFRVPSGKVVSRECAYGATASAAEPVVLQTKGGSYNWSVVDGLTLKRGTPVALSSGARDLLARVAYDCGVGCGMIYTQVGSSSGTFRLGESFRDVFSVSNAQVVTKNGSSYGGGLHDDVGNYPALIYNQIRGGAPVVLGIDGHEVVACGYGIDADEAEYTYVFVGWGGAGDAWYALPSIDTKATSDGTTYESTFVDEVLTAIAPYDDKFVPVVGRCVDAAGNPVPGTVTFGGGETVETDADGYWGVRVSPSDPRWFVDTRGDRHTYAIGKTAEATSVQVKKSVTFSSALPAVQNIVVRETSAVLYDGATQVSTHGTLDGALAAAANCAAPVISLVGPSCLLEDAEIGFSCEIRGNGYSVEAGAAALSVAAGARVLFDNVAFETTASPAVTVAAGGVIAVSGEVETGIVSVSGGTGLELAGAITSPIAVSSTGEVFGTYSCPASTAASCAALLLNAADDELGGEASNGQLKWGAVAVPDAAATLRLIQGGQSTNYRSFRTLMKFVTGNASIAVLRECPLDEAVPVGRSLVLYGAASGAKVVASGAGAFVIEGGSMVVSNLLFTGVTSDAIFHVGSSVRGASGDLTLTTGAVVQGVVGRNTNWGGAIVVEKGIARVKTGAAIRDCTALGRSSYGGGAYAFYEGSTIALAGGVITGCSAMKGGGGVAAAYSAKVQLSGPTRVFGNTVGGTVSVKTNDVDSVELVEVVGALTAGAGTVGVRVSNSASSGSGEGDVFATYSQSMSSAQVAQSARAFFNTTDASLAATVGTSGRQLLWMAAAEEVPEADAVVRLVYTDGTKRFYASVNDAFSAITGDCAVELLADGCVLDGDVVADCAVTLRTVPTASAAFALYRADGRIMVSPTGSLSISNVAIFGALSPEVGTGRLLEVDGGSLALKSGAAVRYVFGSVSRADSAVVVYNRGSFEMQAGALVENCFNGYVDSGAGYNSGAGGGVLIDGVSSARFLGGSVTGCSATFGGGVCVCNESVAYVSGEFSVTGNFKAGAESASDFLVEDLSRLYLDAPLTGASEIGAISGFRADTNLVACVEGWRSWNFTVLTNSAARFFKDERPVVRGFVVTNASDTALVVWSTAIAKDGSYESVEGEQFFAAGTPPEIPDEGHEEEYADPEPIAFTAIEGSADRKSWTLRLTNAVQWCEYTIYAVDSLEGGFPLNAASPVTNFQWKSSDKEIEVVVPAGGSQRFWRATAAPGVVGE